MNRRSFLLSSLGLATGCCKNKETSPSISRRKWNFYTQEQILDTLKQSKHTLSFGLQEKPIDEHYEIMFDFVRNSVNELGPGMPWVVTNYRLAIYFENYPGTSSDCPKNQNMIDAGVFRNVRLIVEDKWATPVLPQNPYVLMVGVQNKNNYFELPKETRLLKVYERELNDNMRAKPVIIEERQR